MEKIAFKMKLKPGCVDEYRLRHDAIWPKLVNLLRTSGVRDYSIYLDEETLSLFAVLWRSSDHRMADLMETLPSNEPVATPLPCVFHLE